MAFFKWLVGGTAGGAIGGVLWILLAYYLNIEVGYVAIVIGILTGLGVRMFSRYDGKPPAIAQSVLACLIAGVMVLAAKFMVVSLSVDRALAAERAAAVNPDQNANADQETEAARMQQFIDSLPSIEVSASELPLRLARNEAQRREEAGEVLNWPAGRSLDTADTEADMPPEMLQWARDKVAAMTPEEVAAAIKREEETLNALVAALRTVAEEEKTEIEQNLPQPAPVVHIDLLGRFEIFMDSLGWFDLLWLVIAMGSAYKISGDDESNVPPENARL